jgi:hypothetical protein
MDVHECKMGCAWRLGGTHRGMYMISRQFWVYIFAFRRSILHVLLNIVDEKPDLSRLVPVLKNDTPS